MSNLRTLRQSGVYSESQNLKAQVRYASPLPVIDPRDWQGKTVPERQWFVEGLIPDRTVTNLSGAGGSGKTEIILQLIAASSLKTQWFGKDVSIAPSAAISCPNRRHRRGSIRQCHRPAPYGPRCRSGRSGWVNSIGLKSTFYGTHSMRRTKVTQIYRKTGNLRAVQFFLRHKKCG